jgi:hypothetical protein
LEKLTREQVEKVCVICVKIVAGDYVGVYQDLSLSRISIGGLRLPWSRDSD